MTQGAWPDPWRIRPSRERALHGVARASTANCTSASCPHARAREREDMHPRLALKWAMRWRALRVAFDAVGWPMMMVIALSMPSDRGLERAGALAITMWLLVAERWRSAMKRREEADLDRFLRALDEDDPYAETVDVGLGRPQLGGSLRVRERRRAVFVDPPPPSASVARRIASVNERPTAVQRPSERPTVPDSTPRAQLTMLEPDPNRPAPRPGR